jgi:hypothetical protein
MRLVSQLFTASVLDVVEYVNRKQLAGALLQLVDVKSAVIAVFRSTDYTHYCWLCEKLSLAAVPIETYLSSKSDDQLSPLATRRYLLALVPKPGWREACDTYVCVVEAPTQRAALLRAPATWPVGDASYTKLQAFTDLEGVL